jgi:hypothetical protein
MSLIASPASDVCHSDAFGELLLQPWQLAELLDKVHRFLQAQSMRMRRHARTGRLLCVIDARGPRRNTLSHVAMQQLVEPGEV